MFPVYGEELDFVFTEVRKKGCRQLVIDGVDQSRGEAWSVIVKGHAVELQGMEELFEATALPLFPWHASPKHRFVKIEPVQLTGRRFQVVGPEAWVDPVRVGA